jgi:hypothetical protein
MYSCICAPTDHCNLNQCKLGTHCVHYNYYFRLWWTRRNLVGCCFIDVWSSVTWRGMQHYCVALRLPICAACIQVPSDSNFINLFLASDKCTQRCRTSWHVTPVRKYRHLRKLLQVVSSLEFCFISERFSRNVLVAIRERLDDETNKQHSCFAFGRSLFHVYPRHQLTWQIILILLLMHMLEEQGSTNFP